jgi:anionic cell wall polymer biosynthesis LytR-Cps2A-Psr (LCP) family protein
MKKISSILILVLVAALLAGAMFTLQLMKRPLDAPLELSLPAQDPAAQAQATAAAPQAQKKTCGESGTMALLVSGLSMPEWRPVHGVGAVRLVKVDFDNQSVAVLNVPRALFVANTNLPTPAETALTVVYRMAREAAKGNNPQEINRKATQDMAQVLVDEFGYVPDHYITVDPARFVELVDSLEGINVTLSAEVDGTPDELGIFPGGAQQLDGAQALELLRILHPAGVSNPSVWQKFERQRVVTLGLLGAMLQPANWGKLPEAAKEARQMVVTDLSVNQVLDLACMVKEAGEATTFQDVPAGMVQVVSDEEIRMQDAEAIKALIQGYGSEKK